MRTHDGDTEYVSCHKAVNGRPSWPYEDWKYDDCADAEEETECEIDVQTNS